MLRANIRLTRRKAGADVSFPRPLLTTHKNAPISSLVALKIVKTDVLFRKTVDVLDDISGKPSLRQVTWSTFNGFPSAVQFNWASSPTDTSVSVVIPIILAGSEKQEQYSKKWNSILYYQKKEENNNLFLQFTLMLIWVLELPSLFTASQV